MLDVIIATYFVKEKLEGEMLKRLKLAVRQFFAIDTIGMKEAFIRAFTNH